jgi:DNA-binding transcriptional MerR regulator
MREHMLLRIGEFARIGRVSIATLRHYEKAGLLKPQALDRDTGYRYYSLDHLARLNRIIALRELNFPLEQIARLLAEDLDTARLRAMFTLKQAQTQHMIDTERARLTRIAARLRQIEQEGKMPTYDVLLKQVDPLLVASIRASVPIISERGHLYATLSAYLEREGVRRLQPDLLLLHSRHEIRDEVMSIDVEVAMPLPASTTLAANERIAVRTLPGACVASTVHSGDDLSLAQAYVALHRWMQEHRYRLCSPPRQLHLQRAEQMDPGLYVTEVQFPVEPQAG